ncbi:hypothetical protein AX15_005030 [Amanita polypyramis BW_CC]|nr:hypothetical protein AX15_005030 [Amanita polypyramis BW_CC]
MDHSPQHDHRTIVADLPSERDFLQANKQHFDRIACHYDQSNNAVRLAGKCARAILDSYPFRDDGTDVMDYACGTGLVSRELAPYARRILGVDISAAMVDRYNLRVHNQGIAPEEIHAVCTELEGREGELKGDKFDVIVCTSAFHHMVSIERATRTLAFFLKPGGALIVIDLEKTDADVHQSHRHVVPHPGGLEEADIKQAFQCAGLGSITYKPAFKAKLKGIPVTLFIAKGVKPH